MDEQKPRTLKHELKSMSSEAAILMTVLTFLASEMTLSGLIATVFDSVNASGLDASRAQGLVDIFVGTVPLTIGIALLTWMVLHDMLDNLTVFMVAGLVILGGAAWLGNRLHLGRAPVPLGSHASGGLLGQVIGLIKDYYAAYGPLPFIKSLALGVFFGRWSTRLGASVKRRRQPTEAEHT